MKHYIKQAVKELLSSEKPTIEVHLKSKNDFKKNPVRLAYNKVILALQQKLVPCHLKNFILRTTGMHIGHDACIPHDITFDPYFPELIFLDKGCLVGGASIVITHEVKNHSLVLGKVIVKERAMLGGLCVLKPGAVISKNSILNLKSELSSEMPEGQLWGGIPVKHIMTFSNEDIDKFFKPSNREHKEYYKEARAKIKAFLKDPSQSYLKIYYNGNRLNAGDDWWRARNTFMIWYNGAIIEFTRLLPNSSIKTALLRMAGVKIGKNVYIGKGVVFDHIFPDTITVEDNVNLDDHVYVDGHEYTITQTVFGRTLIKKGAHLKNHTHVRIGTTIGENAVVEADSLAQRVIPDNEVWGGNPVKFIKKKD